MGDIEAEMGARDYASRVSERDTAWNRWLQQSQMDEAKRAQAWQQVYEPYAQQQKQQSDFLSSLLGVGASLGGSYLGGRTGGR